MNAAKKNDKYFEESSQGRVAFTSIVLFIVCFIAVHGGIVLMGFGFDPHMPVPAQIATFCAGLLTCIGGFALAFVRPSQAGKNVY